MIDFIEISQERVNKFKASLGSSDKSRYKNTLYVAISKDDKVTCSYEATVLREAYQCILIHCRLDLAQINRYDWYKPEFINYNGHNLGKMLEGYFSFNIDCRGYYTNQKLILYRKEKEIFCCGTPFEKHMQEFWDAYCNAQDNKKDESAELKKLLAQKEERIQELEEQVSQYKQLLDGIKELIKKWEMVLL